jgi:hypothetical protein
MVAEWRTPFGARGHGEVGRWALITMSTAFTPVQSRSSASSFNAMKALQSRFKACFLPMDRSFNQGMTMRRILIALAMTLFALPAWAITINSGVPEIFNFSSSAPGPFTSINLEFGIDACTLFENGPGCLGPIQTDQGTITLFDGLNGSGGSFVFASWSDGGRPINAILGPGSLFAMLTDGEFSLVYSATAGSIDAAPFAIFTDAAGATIRLDPDATGVPEPESLALLCLGIVAMATARRKRVQ